MSTPTTKRLQIIKGLRERLEREKENPGRSSHLLKILLNKLEEFHAEDQIDAFYAALAAELKSQGE